MLTSRFETLKMNENQNFSSFYSELSDIVNSSFNLGEPIPNSKVIRKILRSLLERFRPKVIAIEESKDIDYFRVDELVGSIQAYEMTLPSFHKMESVRVGENPKNRGWNPVEYRRTPRIRDGFRGSTGEPQG